MAIVHLVIGLALIEYYVFVLAVGRARAKFGVPAPATAGNPDFERVLRIQANTLEQLIVLIPSMLIFGLYVNPLWSAVLGLLFIVGRIVYFVGYSRDASKRHIGFGLSALPLMALLFGAIFGAARAALAG